MLPPIGQPNQCIACATGSRAHQRTNTLWNNVAFLVKQAQTLKQTCFQGYPESAVYVQVPIDSRNSAIHNAYHTYRAAHMPTAHMSTDGCEALSASISLYFRILISQIPFSLYSGLYDFSDSRGHGNFAEFANFFLVEMVRSTFRIRAKM